MGDKTAIEWTEATWNPVSGCSKVSQGCKNCYAERLFPRPYPGRKFTDVRCHPERLDQPLRWARPRRIFVNSMSDLFHEDVPFEFIDQVFAVMGLARQHTFQILTKRPERMLAYLTGSRDQVLADSPGSATTLWHVWSAGIPWERPHRLPDFRWDNNGNVEGSWPLPNVWLGVSVEDQGTADERIPLLLQAPTAVRFLSCEPLLDSIDLHSVRGKPMDYEDAPARAHWINALTGEHGNWLVTSKCVLPDQLSRIDWVIVGGESGPRARPMHPGWARSLRDQCTSAGARFFFKQNGEWVSVSVVAGPGDHFKFPDGATVRRTGKKLAGRTLDGREWNEFPIPQQEKEGVPCSS